LVGDGCLRAGLAGGDRRPAASFGVGEITAAILGGDELTARATAFGGGEPALAWHRRSDLMGDAAKASRCIVLASASWDLSTAVAMGT
jgi:hypothetical protein